jgi:hypothetical protein
LITHPRRSLKRGRRPPGTHLAGSWIECSFDLDGRHVGVSVRRLDDDERRRMAAEIAWFAQGVLSSLELKAMEWPAFLQRILLHDVSITVDEEGLDLIAGFWDRALCRVFEAFVLANGLGPVVRTHLRPQTTRPV